MIDDDTRIGGSGRRFPSTRRSAIIASYSGQAGERQKAYEKIINAYWKPVYTLVRYRWSLSNEDAKDLTQAFFARAIEKQYFEEYQSDKGTFRTFIRTCVTRFVINESRHAHRLKRGGGQARLPLETAGNREGASLEEFFEKEWIRNLFSLAVEDLRKLCAAKGKTTPFELFERYDLDQTRTSYAELASEYAISVTDVTNYLAWSRREFRNLVLGRIRDITSDEKEFRHETRLVLGYTE
jgi:RNA polymerase sigma factor (sigma-70 family)